MPIFPYYVIEYITTNYLKKKGNIVANPYDTLGVTQKATQEEIKAAYHRLAKKYHPDLNNQDPEKVPIFQKVNIAYELLSDQQLRQKYDDGLIDAFGKIVKKKEFHQQDYSFDSAAFYEAIKRELNRRKHEKNRQEKPIDFNYTLKLTWMEAIKGCKKDLNIGGVKENFSIPAGVTDGQTITFKGRGDDTGKNVHLKIFVATHDMFAREGNNIILNFPITIKEAISGGAIDIPTIHGKVSIRMAPNIKSGTLLKLKGKGILDLKTHEYGDQYTYIQMVLPKEITPEFKTTIEALEDKYPYNPRGAEMKKE